MDKLVESLDEFVEKGKLTKEEAAAMFDKIVEEGKVETEKARPRLRSFNDATPRKRRDEGPV